jgi:hypothetical protein
VGEKNMSRLETVDLNGLGIKLETLLLVNEEFLDILALVSLQLDYFTHFRVVDDGAIASELLLDDLEDLLLIKFLRKTLNGRQGFTSISLLDTNMDIVLCLFGFSGILVGFGEGIVGLEIFD